MEITAVVNTACEEKGEINLRINLGIDVQVNHHSCIQVHSKIWQTLEELKVQLKMISLGLYLKRSRFL